MHYFNKLSFLLSIYLFFILVDLGNAVHCYECDSSVDMTCGETLADGHTHEPSDCSHLQEPFYCVKMTGLYEGELGTKRFCSARDFGNYCEMVRRPGDERLYRACTYTCSSHYCNGASTHGISFVVLSLLTVILLKNKMLIS